MSKIKHNQNLSNTHSVAMPDSRARDAQISLLGLSEYNNFTNILTLVLLYFTLKDIFIKILSRKTDGQNYRALRSRQVPDELDPNVSL